MAGLSVRGLIEELGRAGVPVLRYPADDLPSEADNLDGGLDEARAELAAGLTVSHEEVKRMFGLA